MASYQNGNLGRRFFQPTLQRQRWLRTRQDSLFETRAWQNNPGKSCGTFGLSLQSCDSSNCPTPPTTQCLVGVQQESITIFPPGLAREQRHPRLRSWCSELSTRDSTSWVETMGQSLNCRACSCCRPVCASPFTVAPNTRRIGVC